MPRPPTKGNIVKAGQRVPCVGMPSVPGQTTFTVAWGGPPSPLLADFLPTLLGSIGGRLYVVAEKGLRVTLIDGGGSRRPIPLGAGHCAYVALSADERAIAFRLEARNAAGRTVEITRPGSWPGFPSDRA